MSDDKLLLDVLTSLLDVYDSAREIFGNPPELIAPPPKGAKGGFTEITELPPLPPPPPSEEEGSQLKVPIFGFPPPPEENEGGGGGSPPPPPPPPSSSGGGGGGSSINPPPPPEEEEGKKKKTKGGQGGSVDRGDLLADIRKGGELRKTDTEKIGSERADRLKADIEANRNPLLRAIEQGQQLKKVDLEKLQEEKKQRLKEQKKSDPKDVGNILLNVMNRRYAIMPDETEEKKVTEGDDDDDKDPWADAKLENIAGEIFTGVEAGLKAVTSPFAGDEFPSLSFRQKVIDLQKSIFRAIFAIVMFEKQAGKQKSLEGMKDQLAAVLNITGGKGKRLFDPNKGDRSTNLAAIFGALGDD